MGSPPDVRVGRVGLFGTVAVRQVVGQEPGAHLPAAAELADERRVEPRLVDAQVRVGQQPVPVEPLDVVALERRAVPQIWTSSSSIARTSSVPVTARPSGVVLKRSPAARADMERPQVSAASPSSTRAARQSTSRTISAPYRLARPGPSRCRARRTARCRRCKCTAPHPCHASMRPRLKYRARQKTMPTRSPIGRKMMTLDTRESMPSHASLFKSRHPRHSELVAAGLAGPAQPEPELCWTVEVVSPVPLRSGP